MARAGFRKFLLLCLMALLVPHVQAGESKHEVFVSLGTGPQHNTGQHNSQFALDHNFYELRRSPRSGLSLGAGYTRLWTDADTDRNIDVISLYPQLTLWPVHNSLQGYYFFVRALGPSYLSANNLGKRQQAEHFAFQAQVGIGYRKQLAANNAVLMQVSWKHFSNANLFDDNDGIDIPFVVSLGFAY